jgi:hypothetical protein
MRSSLPICALILALLTLVAVEARTEPIPRIALVLEQDSEQPTPRRLRAELEGLGFEVVEVTTTEALPDPESLEQIARDAGAFAAVRITASRGGVEVWIADRVTGKTVLRELVVPPEESVDEVVALRAVELLRASLLELGLPAAARGPVAPAPAVERLLPPAPKPVPPPPRPQPPARPPAFTLGIGPALAASPGGIGPSALVRVGARLRLVSRIGADALLLLPTLPVTLEGAEGSADVSFALFGLGLDASLLPDESAWRSRVGLAGGLIHLRVVGAADAPFGADAETRFLGAGLGRIDVLGRVTRGLWLGAELAAGVTFQRVLVDFAGREAATWGQPFGVLALLVEIPGP